MKVLVVYMQYDYGVPARGLSGLDYYFVQPLANVADSVITFDFMAELHKVGRERMNQALLDTVRRERPDITLVSLYTDQFIPEIIREINKHTITVAYLFDDTWRVTHSRFWAHQFSFVTTSDVNGVRRFRDAGFTNVVYSPFGCNTNVYTRKELPHRYDVSFVGQYHPHRAWYFRQLQKAGIDVQAWGYGWNNGRISFDEMIDVFNQSKINLNMSNCVSWDLRYLLSSPKALKDTLNSLRLADAKTREMVKARHFEINACGGFQLTYYVEGLERFYEIGEEVALYATPDDLIEKIRYYLHDADERNRVATRGYKRTITQHTLEQRYRALLEQVAPNEPGRMQPGADQ